MQSQADKKQSEINLSYTQVNAPFDGLVTARLVSVPAAWTSVCGPDPVVVVSAGRSAFRVQDLMELARLVEGRLAGPAVTLALGGTAIGRGAGQAAGVDRSLHFRI